MFDNDRREWWFAQGYGIATPAAVRKITIHYRRRAKPHRSQFDSGRTLARTERLIGSPFDADELARWTEQARRGYEFQKELMRTESE
jgi:hypothetical protein